MTQQYEKIISSMIIDASKSMKMAKEKAAEQEQKTRRAFAAAFEARIAELEHELVDRDDEIVDLQTQLDQYIMKMKSAETLLMRLKDQIN
jgi:hypothetical protein